MLIIRPDTVLLPENRCPSHLARTGRPSRSLMSRDTPTNRTIHFNGITADHGQRPVDNQSIRCQSPLHRRIGSGGASDPLCKYFGPTLIRLSGGEACSRSAGVITCQECPVNRACLAAVAGS